MNKRLHFLAAALLVGCSLTKTPEKACSLNYALAGDLTRFVIDHGDTQKGLLEIIQLQSTCYEASMQITFRTQLNLWPGAPSSLTLEIPYFVAVVGDKDEVYDHASFVLTYKGFGPVDVQTHKQSYTLPKNFNKDTMRVVVGFSLSAEQRKKVATFVENRRARV
jgi:hypothetical protein